MQPRSTVQRAGVAITVEIRVKEGHDEEFLRLLTPVLNEMRHETTFINAILHRDAEDPTRFMLYETWADLNELAEVQLQRAYRKGYIDRLPAILREERRITVWQPLRSDFSGG